MSTYKLHALYDLTFMHIKKKTDASSRILRELIENTVPNDLVSCNYFMEHQDIILNSNDVGSQNLIVQVFFMRPCEG